MIDDFAGFRFELLIELVTIDGIAVASKRVTSLVAEAGLLSTLELVYARLASHSGVSGSGAVARVFRARLHVACRAVFAWVQVACHVCTIESCVAECTFTFIQIVSDGVTNDLARSAITAGLRLMSLSANMGMLALRAVMVLVAHAFMRSHRVYALTMRGAGDDRFGLHLSALVDVLRAVGAFPSLGALAFVE